MVDNDAKRLLEVVAQAIRAARIPVREMEAVLGISHGSLSAFLRGKLDLKARHLLALARLLKVPPGDFLELGCPETTASARHRLADWTAGGTAPPPFASPQRGAAGAAGAALPATMEELSALIRESVRQVVAEGAGKPER